jgi:hypothetical protein
MKIDYFPDIDTLRYRVQSQVALPQDDIRVSVAVTTLVSTQDTDQQAIYHRISAALAEFMDAEWVLSKIERYSDAMGYERVELNASVRVPPSQNYNLEERVRRASREGLALSSPQVDYSLPAAKVSEAVQSLRERVLEEVQQQAERFNHVTGRAWRLGHIEFGVEGQKNYLETRTGKGAYRSADTDHPLPDENLLALTGSERIVRMLCSRVTSLWRPAAFVTEFKPTNNPLKRVCYLL